MPNLTSLNNTDITKAVEKQKKVISNRSTWQKEHRLIKVPQKLKAVDKQTEVQPQRELLDKTNMDESPGPKAKRSFVLSSDEENDEPSSKKQFINPRLDVKVKNLSQKEINSMLNQNSECKGDESEKEEESGDNSGSESDNIKSNKKSKISKNKSPSGKVNTKSITSINSDSDSDDQCLVSHKEKVKSDSESDEEIISKQKKTQKSRKVDKNKQDAKADKNNSKTLMSDVESSYSSDDRSLKASTKSKNKSLISNSSDSDSDEPLAAKKKKISKPVSKKLSKSVKDESSSSEEEEERLNLSSHSKCETNKKGSLSPEKSDKVLGKASKISGNKMKLKRKVKSSLSPKDDASNSEESDVPLTKIKSKLQNLQCKNKNSDSDSDFSPKQTASNKDSKDNLKKDSVDNILVSDSSEESDAPLSIMKNKSASSSAKDSSKDSSPNKKSKKKSNSDSDSDRNSARESSPEKDLSRESSPEKESGGDSSPERDSPKKSKKNSSSEKDSNSDSSDTESLPLKMSSSTKRNKTSLTSKEKNVKKEPSKSKLTQKSKNSSSTNKKSSIKSKSLSSSDESDHDDNSEKSIPTKKQVSDQREEKSEDDSSEPSVASDTDKVKKSKSDNETKKVKGKEVSTKDDPLKVYKKYLRTMGVFIRNYEGLFKGCKSIKSKKEKLLSVMKENGLRDKPTLEKCKKLRIKNERKKEVQELDLDNIISTGRSRRNVYSLYANTTGTTGELGSPLKKSRIKKMASDSDSE